jgi:hypothetical protein
MELNLTKIFGWVLIFAGLAIIIWPLYFSYNIFQGESKTPDIFGIEEEAIITPITSDKKVPVIPSGLQEDFQKEMEEMIGDQFKEVLPVDALPELLNLIAWSIIAGLFILGGFQISNLGVKLVKK